MINTAATTTSAATSAPASLKWVKQVTEIGLTFMREKVRKERLNSVMNGSDIDCNALGTVTK